MAEITAAAVMKLRKLSGQGMMDCKKALEECNGDPQAAMELLRKKGLATLEKRADRDTTQADCCRAGSGRQNGGSGIVVLRNGFVAKNDDFIAACEKLADCALNASSDSAPSVC